MARKRTKDNDTVAGEIGKRIRSLRRQMKMTQDDLDDVCSRSNLSNIENGKNIPDLITLIRIADRLGVPLGDLLPGSVTAPSGEQRLTGEINSALSQMSDENRVRFLEFMVSAAKGFI